MIYNSDGIAMTPEEYFDLAAYEHTWPTDPSPGRIFRVGPMWCGLVVVVEADPEPNHVLWRRMVPEFVDSPGGSHRISSCGHRIEAVA